MAFSRDLADLHPKALLAFARFALEMAKAKIPFIVTSTARTRDEQEALYAQGREPLLVVNSLRRKAGLPPISEKFNRKKVTWTKNSRHLPRELGSVAFDFAILKTPTSVCWDPKADIDGDSIPEYEEAGRIAEKCGLKWGGRWKTPDYPHLEVEID